MRLKDYEAYLIKYPEYRLHKNLLLYVSPVLVILGTFGNIFSFIILRRKAMTRQSTYLYLAMLSITDTLVLYVGLFRTWLGELMGTDIRDENDPLCKLTVMFLYSTSDYSVWLIIAVTVERYIVVCAPLHASSLCNNSRARRVIIAIFILIFGVNLHFLWTLQINQIDNPMEVNQTLARCEPKVRFENLVNNAWPLVDATIYSFLPFVVILVLNALIIRKVLRAREKRARMQSIPQTEQEVIRNSKLEAGTKVTVMLLTVSFTFLLTTLPTAVMLIVLRFLDTSNTPINVTLRYKVCQTITTLLMYVNHSINFFLYCATGQKFRAQLMWLVFKKRVYVQRFTWTSSHSPNSNNNSTGNPGTNIVINGTKKNSCAVRQECRGGGEQCEMDISRRSSLKYLPLHTGSFMEETRV